MSALTGIHRLLGGIRTWAGRIKQDSVMLWFACRHPDTPWLARAICVFVVAYALSPIDLIPDFIPVLGYLDEVLLLPVLIRLAVRLLPAAVIEASRVESANWIAQGRLKPSSHAGAVAVVAVWIVALLACGYWFLG
jgi:uncharacterized membrane protein YkvA (DUF1232 family)